MSARTAYRIKPGVTPSASFISRLLDPIDRLAETIYSILIFLSFTLAFRLITMNGNPAAPVDRAYVNSLLLAALGAIIAWGLIDGIMYALLSRLERGERHRLLHQIQSAETEQNGLAIVAEEFDYILEPITGEAERNQLYQSVLKQLQAAQPQPVSFRREDFAGALGSLLVAVLAVLPSLLPFLLLRESPKLALRLSNTISFLMLFYAGYQWGKYTGSQPWQTGLLLSLIGALMVLIAIALGG